MKNIERFIFDLDNTLIFQDFTDEKEYFNDIFKNNGKYFNDNLNIWLKEYEATHTRYDREMLRKFLEEKSKLPISKTIIDGWLQVSINSNYEIEDTAIEVLEYLKSKGKNIVILTNFIRDVQVQVIKNSELFPYITDIYCGDYLKPNKESYYESIGNYDIKKCLMIGDNYEKDYLGPRNIGLNSILYDRNDRYKNVKDRIKSLRKIKEL